jgi:hypothetical protein
MLRELKENGEYAPWTPLAPDMLSRVTSATTYSELAKRWLATP